MVNRFRAKVRYQLITLCRMDATAQPLEQRVFHNPESGVYVGLPALGGLPESIASSQSSRENQGARLRP